MWDDALLKEMAIRWTARLAVACYVARIYCDTSSNNSAYLRQTARWWWTIGCGWFIFHVAAAFHFEHYWSHQAAFDATARRTAEMTGWNSGWGLYVNEAFLGLWIVDTILWWRDTSWPDDRRIYWIIQGIFGFLMIQATAVFGPPFWKPITLVVVAVICRRALKMVENRS